MVFDYIDHKMLIIISMVKENPGAPHTNVYPFLIISRIHHDNYDDDDDEYAVKSGFIY